MSVRHLQKLRFFKKTPHSPWVRAPVLNHGLLIAQKRECSVSNTLLPELIAYFTYVACRRVIPLLFNKPKPYSHRYNPIQLVDLILNIFNTPTNKENDRIL